MTRSTYRRTRAIEMCVLCAVALILPAAPCVAAAVFTGGATSKLDAASSVVGTADLDYGVLVCCWFKTNGTPAALQTLFSSGNDSVGGDARFVRLSVNTTPAVFARHRGSTTNGDVTHGTAFSTDQWVKVYVEWKAANSRAIAFDAEAAASNPTPTGTGVNANKTRIGCLQTAGGPVELFNGKIAHLGVWTITTQAERDAIIADFKASKRPSDCAHSNRLVLYQPLVAGVNSAGSVGPSFTNAGGVSFDGDNPLAESPENITLPTISGQPSVTLTLSSSTGTWANSPTSYAYQWRRDSGGGFVNISGATASTHTLTAADVNATIRCAVTATNVVGNSTANTALVGPVWTGPVVGSGYDAINSLLNPNPNTLDNDHQKVFTVFSPDDNNSVYNPGLWGGGAQVLDLTGIAWKHTAPSGNIHLAAISPNLGITIIHNGGPLGPGHTVTFIAADGTLVERTVNARRVNVGWSMPPSDQFNIVRFSADLPATIAKYPLLANAEQDFVGAPMLFTSIRPDSGGTPFVRRFRLQQITYFDGTFYGLNVPTDPLRLIYHGYPLSGDSGSSRFVLKGAQLVYVATVAGPFDGYSSRQAIGEIRKACRELVDEVHMPVFFEIEKLRAARAQQLRANQ